MPHTESSSTQHAHGGPVEIRRGIYHKNLWLRTGDSLAKGSYLDEASVDTSNAKIFLLDVKGEIKPLVAGKPHGAFGVNFAMPDEGFYNLYLISEQFSESTRMINIAKAEVLKHSCREGHDHVQALMSPRQHDELPLEIIRLRAPAENFHSATHFGDNVQFQLLHHGQPLAGASVTLYTAQGWRNTMETDANGKVSFMMIRDYYPPWSEFKRRHRQDYVVQAVHNVPADEHAATSAYQQTRYETTLNGSYYPSTRDYRSYGYGLLLGTFALSFTAVAVYVYRRRGQQRFKEVRFDEDN